MNYEPSQQQHNQQQEAPSQQQDPFSQNQPQYQQSPPLPQNQTPIQDPRPFSTYADTGFRPFSSASEGYTPNYQSFSPAPDADPTPRYAPPQQQPSQPQSQSTSRPPSSMSGQNQQHRASDPHARTAAGTAETASQASSSQQSGQNGKPSNVIIKVGMVGDAQIGKTSLMVKYVEGSWDEDYIQTLGVNFMEKTITIRNTEITFSIWDLGGQREFVNMLPLVCNDAVAILFMFDLTRKSTLNSIKEWYRQGRGFNKTAIPFLVGTKYDHFVNFPREEQEEISKQVSVGVAW